MEDSFSKDYAEARTKFLVAAGDVKAVLERFPLDAVGPGGVELSTDVAWLGEPDADSVLVTLSGTHGVEGFFGSATQVEWLRRAKTSSPQRGLAVLHVHAVNPYGFAWLRRTNETNVDINRNWIDFDMLPPANPLYNELAEDLCPPEWSQEVQSATWARLQSWIGKHGFPAFQKAVSSGQWNHPKGLFYGGSSPTWSRHTLAGILSTRLKHAKRVCILDFHTGLGPYGYAEPIIAQPRTDPAFSRTRAWIGANAKSLHGDGSVSAAIHGEALSALPALMPHAVVDAVAIECGIRPILEVAFALRADAWLHAYGDPLSPAAAPIKSLIRAAFHSDDPLWQGMALGQGLAACSAAINGLLAT